VWDDDHAATLVRDFASLGLAHHRTFSSHPGNSGLLVVSRWPILSAEFTRFTLAGKPHKPWHADWYGGKGIGCVLIDTPLGPLRVADTHLHARYSATSNEYLHHQLAEALQAADALGDHGARPPAAVFDPVRPPLLLLGDINCVEGSLPRRLLTTRADLTPAAPRLGIDVVMYRPGGDVSVRVKRTATVLATEVDLGDGARGRLSDHTGVLAVLELRRLPRAPRSTLAHLAPLWSATAAEALPLVDAELAAATQRASAARGRGYLLTLLGGVLLFVGRKKAPSGKRGGCVLLALCSVVLHWAVWSMYLGVVYEPYVQRGLTEARARLVK